MSDGTATFELKYQTCPIILTGGGIAANMPGGGIPILSLTDSAMFPDGLLSGGGGSGANSLEYFANFLPLPGASLIDQDVGTYPFANQAVAANAVITKPLAISMLMIVPVREPGGYSKKSATMTALQASLAQHNASGGTYTVATPSFIYTNALMLSFRSLPDGGSKQVQSQWQMDFMIPLLVLEQLQQVQSNLMSRISNQTMINGTPAYSGLGPTVGHPPSNAAVPVIPAASGAVGAGTNAAQSTP